MNAMLCVSTAGRITARLSHDTHGFIRNQDIGPHLTGLLARHVPETGINETIAAEIWQSQEDLFLPESFVTTSQPVHGLR